MNNYNTDNAFFCQTIILIILIIKAIIYSIINTIYIKNIILISLVVSYYHVNIF